MRRRRRSPEEHGSRDRWLVSYADFITLLFAFFVVLYASAQVDKRKVGKLAMAIQVAFQQLGVFDTSSTQIPLNDSEAIPFSKVQAIENAERTADLKRVVEPMKGTLGPSAESSPLKDVQAELEKVLAPEIRNHTVEIKARRAGIIISLREVGFYESGSPSLRASSKDAIDRLAAVLKVRTEGLRIEGHTDNVPIHNGRFASNWELSTARASDLIKLLIDRYGLEPTRLSAAGYAEFHPVASNDTSEGRARNRRVDIIILTPPGPLQQVDAEPSNPPAPSSSAMPH
jgi:chemotaxis protein MotB